MTDMLVLKKLAKILDDDIQNSYDGNIWMDTTEIHKLSVTPSYMIHFCGPEGQKIIIDASTGNVELHGYTPTEASVAFWDLLAKAYPLVAERMKKGDQL